MNESVREIGNVLRKRLSCAAVGLSELSVMDFYDNDLLHELISFLVMRDKTYFGLFYQVYFL